jgi:O-acetyl-ADP-ribose deacetylase (regulator of RNase III)
LIDTQTGQYTPPALDEVVGDALDPRGKGNKLIAHVVPDTSAIWGGNGFASQVRKRFPEAWSKFQTDTAGASRTPQLGEVYRAKLNTDNVYIVHMVAQRGFGKSNAPRLRLATLADCLTEVRAYATELEASVHLPRIGTGHGGMAWDVVKELVMEELVEAGIKTTVYSKPN